MTLSDIKIRAIKHDMTMTTLASKIGCSREWMYRKIKENDTEFIRKIKVILPWLLSLVNGNNAGVHLMIIDFIIKLNSLILRIGGKMKENYGFKIDMTKAFCGKMEFEVKIRSSRKISECNKEKLTETISHIVEKLLEEPNKPLNILVSV